MNSGSDFQFVGTANENDPQPNFCYFAAS